MRSPASSHAPPASAGRGDDGDRAVGVVEDRVLDRADTGTGVGGMAVPAEHDQVGARGVAREYPGGDVRGDVLTDPNVRVLVAPALQRRREAAWRPRPRSRPGRPGRRPRRVKVQLGRDPVPGVHRDQVRAAQRRLLEGERQRLRWRPEDRGRPRRSRGARPWSPPGPPRPGTGRGWRRTCSPSRASSPRSRPLRAPPARAWTRPSRFPPGPAAGGPDSRPVLDGQPRGHFLGPGDGRLERPRGYPAQRAGDALRRRR